jgi:hypothetical protein
MLWYSTETLDNGIPMPVPSALMLMHSNDKKIIIIVPLPGWIAHWAEECICC